MMSLEIRELSMRGNIDILDFNQNKNLCSLRDIVETKDDPEMRGKYFEHISDKGITSKNAKRTSTVRKNTCNIGQSLQWRN